MELQQWPAQARPGAAEAVIVDQARDLKGRRALLEMPAPSLDRGNGATSAEGSCSLSRT